MPRTSPAFTPSGATVDPAGNRIKLPYSLGAANNDGIVYSSGGGQVIGGLVDGREYYFKDAGGGWFQLLTKKSDDPGSTVVDLTALPTDGGRSHSVVLNGQPLSGDASSYGPRSYTQSTTASSAVSQ